MTNDSSYADVGYRHGKIPTLKISLIQIFRAHLWQKSRLLTSQLITLFFYLSQFTRVLSWIW
jgi:hypothetical protein